MNEIILCKYGEIVLKGANKKFFEDMLCRQLKDRSKKHGKFEVTRAQSTIYIKPLDEKMLDEILAKFDRIITVEDGTIIGGLYGAVTEYASKKESKAGIRGIGIPDEYIHQSTQEEQREQCGLTQNMIYASILEEIEKIS